MLNDDKQLLQTVAAWSNEGRATALAFTLKTWGSAPRPVGSMLAISDSGEFEGSVSGGCVENSVIDESEEVIRTGNPKQLRYGVTDETAWSLGMPCGGTIDLLLVKMKDRELAQMILDHSPTTLFVGLVTGSMAIGREKHWSGDLLKDAALLQISDNLHASSDATAQVNDDADVFVRPFARPWRLLIVGAVHIGQPLSTMASLAGFEVTVIDPRAAYLTSERFPDFKLVNDWPDVALQEMELDSRTAVAILSHDHKIDDPALQIALGSAAFYVGALGSRRSHNRRVDRLTQCGLKVEQIERIHAPIGLDIGGNSAGEIAVSILAQVISARNNGISRGYTD